MTSELIETWLRGYCLARGLGTPEVVSEGFWVEVAKPQQIGRYILERFNPIAILGLVDRISESSVYIEFPGALAQALPILPEGWSVRDDAYLMGKGLIRGAAADAEIPVGYCLEERAGAGVVTILARSEAGELAGRGCFATIGNVAIFDQISIEPGHRRRGLGRAVVGQLEQRAVERDMSRGLLVATEEGRALYDATGWNRLSTIVSMISWFEPSAARGSPGQSN